MAKSVKKKTSPSKKPTRPKIAKAAQRGKKLRAKPKMRVIKATIKARNAKKKLVKRTKPSKRQVKKVAPHHPAAKSIARLTKTTGHKVRSSDEKKTKPIKPNLPQGKPRRPSLHDMGKNSKPIKSTVVNETSPNITVSNEVATNLKPRKNQAGLSYKELDHFRDLLLEKRHEIVGDMSSMEREALRSGGPSNLSTLPMHMADMGTDNYEQEFTLGLVEKDRNLLREINRALAKIQNGSYGICEGTAKPIAKARLEAQPWAKFGIEHARQIERGGMGVR